MIIHIDNSELYPNRRKKYSNLNNKDSDVIIKNGPKEFCSIISQWVIKFIFIIYNII
jgi:hypothetical protein